MTTLFAEYFVFFPYRWFTMLHEATDDLAEITDTKTVQLDVEGSNVMHFAALPDGRSSIDPVPFPEKLAVQSKFELHGLHWLTIQGWFTRLPSRPCRIRNTRN